MDFGLCYANLTGWFIETFAATVEWNIAVGDFPVWEKQEGQGSCHSENYRWWTTISKNNDNINNFINSFQVKPK